VTEALKTETKTMGSLAETTRASIVNENHRIADDFLRKRLELGAKKAPELADELPKLKQLNRDISAAVRIKRVAENSENRARWKDKSLGEHLSELKTGGAGVAGAAIGGWEGAAIGIAASQGAKLTKRATITAAGRLAREIRLGGNVAKAKAEATAAGVPGVVIRALVDAGAIGGEDE
jgi:hypothetical protein